MYRPLIAATVLALALFPAVSIAAPAKEVTSAPFSIPKLSYSYDALEPVIDAKTMETHLTKHHQAYVDKLNNEVKVDKALNGKSLEEIVGNVSRYNATVRNNAGGHWNHSFFWNIMTPTSNSGEPSDALEAALTKSFGSIPEFKAAFEKAGTDRFGSGWVWVIADKDGNLSITSTPNQDNPLMDDAPVKGTPLLANDVWEHAYYLTYQNKRADYLKKWWNVVNWAEVSKNYDAIAAK